MRVPTLRSCSASAACVTLLVLMTPAAGGFSERHLTVGRSVRGRPLTALVLGPDRAARKLLVVGCIHGNECAGLAIIAALARQPVPGGVQLWLVGEMNPDGTAANTRQNADGVDLNRNFPYRWQRITDPIYNSGPRPLSEPETRAAVALVERVRPAVTIWYHQHEDVVDMSGGDRGVARRYAQLAGLPPTCLPFLPGTDDDESPGVERERSAEGRMQVERDDARNGHVRRRRQTTEDGGEAATARPV